MIYFTHFAPRRSGGLLIKGLPRDPYLARHTLAQAADGKSMSEAIERKFVTVAKVGSIPEGEGRTFQVGDRLIAVFYQNGEYFAIDDLCPHMGASLGAGYLDEDGIVSCPWHAWRFCVRNGKWADNPRLGVDTFDIRIDGDSIQVSSAPNSM